MDNFYIRSLCGHDVFHLPAGAIKRRHLDLAKERLLHFEVVLILEDMAAGMVQLERMLHWAMPGKKDESQSFGKGDVSIQFTDAQKTILRERNALDLELYEFARERSRLITEAVGRADLSAFAEPHYDAVARTAQW